MRPKLLITGGLGFIGTNFIKRLLMEGDYCIYVIDNFSIGRNVQYLPTDDHLTIFRADLTMKDESLNAYLDGVDYVVHLAAHTSVLESIHNAAYNFDQNVIGTFRIIEQAVKCGVKNFIFASTGAVAGLQKPPINEEMLPRPISPYGASKVAGEAYLSAFSSVGDLSCTVLRFSNVYGPYSEHKESVIAKFIRQIMKDEEVEIYGDGSQTRDYLYIDDLCNVLIAALKASYKYEIFHVGSGAEISINRVVECLEKITNKHIKRKYREFNSGEVVYNSVDISKACKMLSYAPSTSFEIGIEKTVEWFAHSI